MANRVALDQQPVLQRVPWLGRLLAVSMMRREGLTAKAHLLAFTADLKTIGVDWRRHHHFETRRTASLEGLMAGIELDILPVPLSASSKN